MWLSSTIVDKVMSTRSIIKNEEDFFDGI